MAIAWITARLAAAVWILAGCGRPIPELPQVSPDTFGKASKARVQHALDRALKSPRDPSASGELGMLLHAHLRFEGAVSCYRRAVTLAPDEFRWLYYLGAAQAALGLHAEALKSFEKALLVDRTSAPLWAHMSESLHELGDSEGSRRTSEQALLHDPRSPAARYRLARALAGLGRTTEAIASYEEAATLSPEAAPIHLALAALYRQRNDTSRAALASKTAQSATATQVPMPDPLLAAVRALRDDPQTHLSRGRRFETEGKLTEAAAEYEQAIALDASSRSAYANLISVQGRLGRFADALRRYEEIAKLGLPGEEVLNNWGVVQAMQGNQIEAGQSFRAALVANAHSLDAHLNLGILAEQMGKPSQALEHYRHAVEVQPHHHAANLNLGRLYAASGRFDDAINHLTRTLAVEDSETPRCLYALADACARAGRARDAIVYGKQALAAARRFGQRQLAAEIEEALTLASR